MKRKPVMRNSILSPSKTAVLTRNRVSIPTLHGSRVTRHVVSLLISLLAIGVAIAAVAVPPLQSAVTDLTHTLTNSQKSSLEQTLRAFEARKGSQVAVLIVPTTDQESIEQYSIRVAEAWKLGRKGVDDGVLLLVAKDDHKVRIEVGYGLEGALPDATANRIVRDFVLPHFRAGEYYLGVVAGVDHIVRTIDGEPLPAPTLTQRARHPGSNIGSILIFLLFGGIIVSTILRAIFGRIGGATIGAAGAGFIVWLLAGTVVIAVIAAIVSFFITLLTGFGGSGWSNRPRGGFGGFGGWGGGGFGGGGFGGGGGGGGFSGGGGSFGGGGASGSW